MENKQVKRIVLACSLLLIGCGNSPSDPANQSSGGESDKPRVALIMKSLANEFFSTMADGAKTHQQEHADDYDLIVNGIKDELDVSRQAAIVNEMVANGVDIIVIAPADSKALVPALRKAKKAGVIVINIDNRLDAEVLKKEGVEIPFVGPDNKAGARLVGDYLASKLKKGDAVVVLEGIRNTFNAQQRLIGFEEAMKAAGINIIDSQTAEWDTSNANKIASSMLSEHPEIKAILAANDKMALGAIAAVKISGRSGEVQIIGFDNISAVQQEIQKGKILATVEQHGGQLAVFGIESALEMLANPGDIPDDVETPVDLVTAETLAD